MHKFEYTENEPAIRTAMMVRADAKAIGIVTATRAGGGNRKPRTYTQASECISYHNRDRSDAVIFRNSRSERKATKRSSNADASKRITAADLRPIFAD